jgi:hypothetical protein
MPEVPDFSALGEYFSELTKCMDNSPDQKAAAQMIAEHFSSDYFMSILTHLASMMALHQEVLQILADLSGRDLLMARYLPVEHLKLLSKFYVIEWATFSDMTAVLINNILNLGIADQDLHLSMILRNEHVLRSPIPSIFKKYAAGLEHQKYSKMRNDVIHRGQLNDPEIQELEKDWNKLESSRHSFFQNEHISDDEYKARSRELTNRNFELGAKKQQEYRTHYSKTLLAVTEILKQLAHETFTLYQKSAI